MKEYKIGSGRNEDDAFYAIIQAEDDESFSIELKYPVGGGSGIRFNNSQRMELIRALVNLMMEDAENEA